MNTEDKLNQLKTLLRETGDAAWDVMKKEVRQGNIQGIDENRLRRFADECHSIAQIVNSAKVC